MAALSSSEPVCWAEAPPSSAGLSGVRRLGVRSEVRLAEVRLSEARSEVRLAEVQLSGARSEVRRAGVRLSEAPLPEVRLSEAPLSSSVARTSPQTPAPSLDSFPRQTLRRATRASARVLERAVAL